MMQNKVIVIGAGASGMMAAISAAESGAPVVVIEKNHMVGKKLLATGGGRCNVTNRKDIKNLIAHIPGNGRFLYSVFHAFNAEDSILFFKSLGVELKEEEHGRMFPVTNQSKTIVDAMYHRMKQLQVEIVYNTAVKRLVYKEGQVEAVETQNGDTYYAKTIIVACGGRAAPETGSTGDGYKWAKKAGHTISPLYPTEVPLVSKEVFIQNQILMGLSLRNVSLSVKNGKGKEVVKHQMDVIFTHFGISGPAALRCSMFVHQVMNKEAVERVQVTLDALPNMQREELLQVLEKEQKQGPNKTVKTILKLYIPERYAIFLLEKMQIQATTPMSILSTKQYRMIVETIKNFSFYVHKTLPLEKAFVTGGGVSVKEVYPQTMESKYVRGLYFTGEILDINGYTGGYNITAAFATGYVAGKSATGTL